MARKKYDLAVKTGEYTRNGETKGRWQNIGAVMVGDDGNPFLMLERTFNPAGVPNPDNRSTVLVSCFEPKQHDGQQQPRQQAPQPEPASEGAGFDQDIPFAPMPGI